MTKLSALPSATTVGSTDTIPLVQSGTTKKIATLILLGAVSVKLYGAVGDGVTNDTAAFTAALAANSTIFCPFGTYVVKDVAVGTHKTIYGCGSIFKPASGAQSIFTMTGYKPEVYNCYFDAGNGNLASTLLTNAEVVVMDAIYPTVANCQFLNAATGLLLKVASITTSSETTKGSFYNLKFDTFSQRGVLVGPNVNACSFSDIRAYSGVTQPAMIPKAGAIGFQIYSTGSLSAYGGHTITNVDCEQSEYGFQLTDATLCLFDNCIGDSVSTSGFQVSGASNAIKFSNCFAGTCLNGFEIANTSSNIYIDSATTILNGVVPPWWVGPAAFYTAGSPFDIAVKNTASVQIGTWFGDSNLYADTTTTLKFDGMDNFYANTTATVAAGSTNYFGPQGINSLELGWVAPAAGVLTGLTTQCNSAPGVGQTYTYTVRIASADTGLTCTTSGNASFASSATRPVTFTAGQNISIKLVTSAGAAAAYHRTTLSLRYF